MKLTIKLISSVKEFESLQNDWNALYAKSGCSTIFSSWDWMFTWWEVFADQYKRELFIICLYEGDLLVGLAPFQIISLSPKTLVLQGKTLCFLGTGEAREDNIITQYIDFLVLPGREKLMVDSVSEYLFKSKKKWDFADLEYLLKDALVLNCFLSNDYRISRKKLEYGVRFFIPEMRNFKQYLDEMPHRWRKMYEKKSRIIARDGNLTISSTENRDSLDLALKQLADMNRSRWEGRVRKCVFDSPRFYEFHQKIIKQLAPKKKAEIRTLSLDGKPLAAYYFFSDKNQIHYYQSGFDVNYGNKYSPLFLLICNEIGVAIENDKMFDFMYTDSTDSYKKHQYAAIPQSMYRLYWSVNPVRLFIFNCVKAIQFKVSHFFEKAQENLVSKIKRRVK